MRKKPGAEVDAITLAAGVDGQDANAATNDHILRLQKLRASDCVGPYSLMIDELGLVMRIEGSVRACKRTGVGALFSRNSRRVTTAAVYIPRRRLGAAERRSFLVEFPRSER